MRARLAMIVAVLVAVAAGEAWSTQQPMSLLEALERGRIEAVFYGNGDQSVRGRIRRSPFGPEQIYVPPGTQFWAQRPGLQGMTTLGYVPINLQMRPIAYVEIPTACTNLDRAAPTGYDIMTPTPCPDPRMEVLCSAIGRVRPERAVAQLAVWAIANDPPWEDVSEYAETRSGGEDEEAMAAGAENLRAAAARVLMAAGLDPASFAMFK